MTHQSMFERLFGVRTMPWVIRVYLLLFGVFALLLLWTAVRPFGNIVPGVVDDQLSARLFELSSDGLKTVLGALLGSLSLAAEATWREKPIKK